MLVFGTATGCRCRCRLSEEGVGWQFPVVLT